MNVKKYKSTYKSRDGVHNISYHVWVPKTKPIGVIQISHGMCEYVMRYEPFADFLTEHGFVVCGNDHLGHGDSVDCDSEFGYFSENNGWQNAVFDLHTLTIIVKKKFPNLPYFMFGHSMGSFMARAYCTKFGKEFEGVVFSGTKSGMGVTSGLLSLISAMEKVRGPKYRSKLINHLAFGAYNAKIHDNKTDYDWICRDENIVDNYNNDSKCNFIFTLNGFDNLMNMLWYVNNRKWFFSYRKDLPTLLTAGDQDPVGEYGLGVEIVYRRMHNYHCDVQLKMYKGARHELLNETNHMEVYEDVLKFFMGILEKIN